MAYRLFSIPNGASPLGYKALVDKYSLVVNQSTSWSYLLTKGERRTFTDDASSIELYPKRYELKDHTNDFAHLEFAFYHEGVNFEILTALFRKITPQDVVVYVRAQPFSKYGRIIWYLYEKIMNTYLDGLVDLEQGSYIDLLDPDLYYTCKGVVSKRHRVRDNSLGTLAFCPFVRKTKTLAAFETKDFKALSSSLLEKYPHTIIIRALHYLYVKETMSSFEIEHEIPTSSRVHKFVHLLSKAGDLQKLSKEELIKLQNTIVDERFVDHDYRKSQNYVGETIDFDLQKIHYISPKPDDVPVLVEGLLACLDRMIESDVHPVVIAALISFGFVFIHPFEDGNGRIHRFLIHYILARTRFTQQGVVFPVSALMLRERLLYDRMLERFSIPLMKAIGRYDILSNGVLRVNGNERYFYQYVDYTSFVEFLFFCIEETITNDFKNELEFLVNYDKAKAGMQEIVDMPDRYIDLFIRLVLKHNGTLSLTKRTSHFSMLTEQEIKALEAVVARYLVSLKR